MVGRQNDVFIQCVRKTVLPTSNFRLFVYVYISRLKIEIKVLSELHIGSHSVRTYHSALHQVGKTSAGGQKRH